ncbi:MAG: NUDIX domain-containing protein [Candidatus Campbellbacteria bacterium]|nr:NUDIX domain-containing protein [Candidatus Campbellbacteria bacterium]
MEKFLKRVVPIGVLHRLLLIWLFFDRRERSAATGCIFYRDELLLIKQNYGNDVWTFPGGFVGKNEELEEGLRREVKEEVGLNLNTVSLFATSKDSRPHKNVTVHHFYAVSESKQCIIDPTEVREIKWVSIEELDKVKVDRNKMLEEIVEFHKKYERS